MNNDRFEYEGYSIPRYLVQLTGGGPDTWDLIARGHMRQYANYCPILPHHTVLEVGCGVGRDAIQLTRLLSGRGRYFGVDIIRESISWCQENISSRFPQFEFFHFDIKSSLHNQGGTLKTTDTNFPVEPGSVDRIILQSVFTHMFEEDITHYLTEFNRLLKNDGRVCASFFIIDEETLQMAQHAKPGHEGLRLSFQFAFSDGCFINDSDHPEGAVGYTMEALQRMMNKSQLQLDQPVHRGFWCGRKDKKDGQDIAVFGKRRGSPSTESILTDPLISYSNG